MLNPGFVSVTVEIKFIIMGFCPLTVIAGRSIVYNRIYPDATVARNTQSRTANEQEATLLKEQLTILLNDATRPLIVGTGAMVLCYVLLRKSELSSDVHWWMIAGIIVTALRAAVVFGFKSSFFTPSLSQKKLALAYVGTLLMTGFLWGALMLMWSAELPVVNQLQLLSLIHI